MKRFILTLIAFTTIALFMGCKNNVNPPNNDNNHHPDSLEIYHPESTGMGTIANVGGIDIPSAGIPFTLVRWQDKLFYAERFKVYMLDITNRASTSVITSQSLSSQIISLAIEDSILFVGVNLNKFYVFNVSSDSFIYRRTVSDLPHNISGKMTLKNKILFVPMTTEILVFNVSSVDNITCLDTIRTDFAYSTYQYRDTLLVAQQDYPCKTFDVSDPSNVQIAHTGFPFGGYMYDVTARWGYVFCGGSQSYTGQARLTAYRNANLGTEVWTAPLVYSGQIYRTVIDNNFLYVILSSGPNSKILVYFVYHPENPVLHPNTPITINSGKDILVVDKYIYVLGAYRLEVYKHEY